MDAAGVVDEVGDGVSDVATGDAVLHLAGDGLIPDLIELTGEPGRVLTLADYRAGQYGALLSQRPVNPAAAPATRLVDTSDSQLRYPGRHEEANEMSTKKTPVELDEEALASAARVLGTTTKKDTVNAALREVSQRLVRLRALEQLGEMADRGQFDEFLNHRSVSRR